MDTFDQLKNNIEKKRNNKVGKILKKVAVASLITTAIVVKTPPIMLGDNDIIEENNVLSENTSTSVGFEDKTFDETIPLDIPFPTPTPEDLER